MRAPLDTLWSRTLADTSMLLMPEYLVADGANVYVGDVAARTVLALDAATGAPRWDVRGRGDTSAIVAPRAFGARRAGGLIVFDVARRMLVALASDGRVAGRIPVPGMEAVRGVCEAGADTLLLVGGAAGSVFAVDGAGRPLAVRPLPWRDLATKSVLVSALLVAPTRTGCVGALVFGRGMTRFEGGGFQPPRGYVEAAPLTDVQVTRRVEHGDTIVSEALADHVLAAIDLAATEHEVLVAFDGRSPDRAHLIDVYDETGAYRSSIRTSRRVEALAAYGSAVFVLTKVAGLPTLVALRRPATSR